MVTKGIYLFWDKKYEQVIYAGRFTGRQRTKDHFKPSQRNVQQINKYVQNHPDRIESVIFCEFDDISNDNLNQLETETIKLFKLNRYRYPNSHVFNFTDGGEGMSGFTHSEESKKKMSKNAPDRSGENNPMYGRTGEDNPNTGVKRPLETRQKISESLTGRELSDEHKRKLSEAHKGKTLSDEHKQKISESEKGKKVSEETKQKMSEKHKGEKNPAAKYILWDITKCHYNKTKMISNTGKNPRRCFVSKYNGKYLPIGYNLDFYTPELINDLINEFLEVN